MVTKEKLAEISSVSEFEELGFGNVEYTISGRGGTLSLSGSRVGVVLDIDESLLPRRVGAYSNYLGGGIRGGIAVSSYSNSITGEKKILLDELLAAFRRVYEYLEDDTGINDDGEDGETNWEAMGTRMARRAGIISAY